MRADKFLAERYGSRTKAAEAIEKGLVLVNGKSVRTKDEIKETDELTFLKAEEFFVSNGGYKLSRGLSKFSYCCRDKIFVDIGASTGGFTDCLLQNGAKKVYAVDVGESLLHSSLILDNRIVKLENTNARYLTREQFDDVIDGVVTDVSFISLNLIFPAIKSILKPEGDAFVLVKPQFECENKNISKNGIVRLSAHPSIVEKVLDGAQSSGLYPFGITPAPIKKGKNVEYVLHLKPDYHGAKRKEEIVEEIKRLIKENTAKQAE